MKFGFEIGRSYPKRQREVIRQEVGRLVEQDKDIRAVIARCARSEVKDYLADLAEPPPIYQADVSADHHEQSRLTDDLMIRQGDHSYCTPGDPCRAGRPLSEWIEARQDNHERNPS